MEWTNDTAGTEVRARQGRCAKVRGSSPAMRRSARAARSPGGVPSSGRCHAKNRSRPPTPSGGAAARVGPVERREQEAGDGGPCLLVRRAERPAVRRARRGGEGVAARGRRGVGGGVEGQGVGVQGGRGRRPRVRGAHRAGWCSIPWVMEGILSFGAAGAPGDSPWPVSRIGPNIAKGYV
ncbi:hypothetical protein SNE510_40980 [Streptomyces sp. NE5-10]|nr:hypothetical protein SNE510_40980 [Streptomyces sp. NE5-10]